jgi:isobutyryl-CoA dehydrogenase
MVLLDECRVPSSNLIGSVNMGFKYAMSALDGGRVNIASTSLGAANYCLQQAIDHVKQRKQVIIYKIIVWVKVIRVLVYLVQNS